MLKDTTAILGHFSSILGVRLWKMQCNDLLQKVEIFKYMRYCFETLLLFPCLVFRNRGKFLRFYFIRQKRKNNNKKGKFALK